MPDQRRTACLTATTTLWRDKMSWRRIPDLALRQPIAGIAQDAWQPVHYLGAVIDPTPER
jgi:hypothetical protein